MRQMPPDLRLRAASTAGRARGPAAPASPVMCSLLCVATCLPHYWFTSEVDHEVVGYGPLDR